MRIYYAYIVDSTAEGCTKHDVISSSTPAFPNKGEIRRSNISNIKTHENLGWVDFLGLGRYDFKDGVDYNKRSNEILDMKIKEFETEYEPKLDKIRTNCGYPPLINEARL